MAILPRKHSILIVDDEKPLQEVFARFLRGEGFCCRTVGNGVEALKILLQERFSLMVTDINMPRLNGMDLLREVRELYPDMSVIMASAVDDRELAVQALAMGASAYVIKPVSRNELIINVINALRVRELMLSQKKENEQLEELVLQRTAHLRQAKEALARAGEETVLRLAKAAEFRDDDTARHTLRMSHYCRIIAGGIGLDDERCELIRLASQLHDVGKIGIPDTILLKPGRLTAEEFTLMKKHTQFGHRILDGSTVPLLQVGAVIARYHHEKFDGSGYPEGLAGNDIPLEARIAAVADVFDALTTKRVYKEAMSIDDALEVLLQGRGHHFDPDLVDVFLNLLDDVLEIKVRFQDVEHTSFNSSSISRKNHPVREVALWH